MKPSRGDGLEDLSVSHHLFQEGDRFSESAAMGNRKCSRKSDVHWNGC